MQSLHEMQCQNSQTITKLSTSDINDHLTKSLPNWQFDSANNIISRKFDFKNFKQTIFFVNAVAYICEKEGHHPDAKFGFNYCEIGFSTHDVGGISLNDMICAAKIDRL